MDRRGLSVGEASVTAFEATLGQMLPADYRRLLLDVKREIRLQIVRTLPMLSWTSAERARVIAILRRDVEHPQTFVRAWALDGLATLAVETPALLADVKAGLAAFERSGKKALAARARQIRARLA